MRPRTTRKRTKSRDLSRDLSRDISWASIPVMSKRLSLFGAH